MILAKKEILEHLKKNKIQFVPNLDQFQLQPNAVDLRIGYSFYIPKTWDFTEKGRVAINVDYLDYKEKKEAHKMIKLREGQYFEILPGEFVIVATLEKINLNCGDVMAILHPRSSTTRRGLLVESGVIDVRYEGHLMIPLINTTRDQIIRVYPGERICQLVFEKVSSLIGEEEALIHGAVQAKYAKSTPYALENIADSKDEINLIKSGKMKELKDKFIIK